MAPKLTARDHLKRWCSRRGRIVELARATEAARSTVHRWLTGDTIPSYAAAIVIESITGIPRALWETMRAARRAAA